MTTAIEDHRAAERDAWARAATGDPGLSLAPASADAGFRSYWRATLSSGDRLVVMDSPPALEDVRPWLRMHELLDTGGVRVPRVLARDADQGFLLLEDLGVDTLLHVIDEANADDPHMVVVDGVVRFAYLYFARHRAENPSSRIERAHFFCFGGVLKTAQWANSVVAGRFELNSRGNGFEVA